MLRVVSILLMLVLGTPAGSERVSTAPSGITLVSAACCDSEAEIPSNDDAKLSEACCCKPASSVATVSYLGVGGSGVDDGCVPPAQVGSLLFVSNVSVHRAAVPRGSRAPPEGQSLFSQSIALLI